MTTPFPVELRGYSFRLGYGSSHFCIPDSDFAMGRLMIITIYSPFIEIVVQFPSIKDLAPIRISDTKFN